MFWLEENLIHSNVLIRGESNFDDKSVQHMFNWSEFHLSEMTCYKIHTLDKGRYDREVNKDVFEENKLVF